MASRSLIRYDLRRLGDAPGIVGVDEAGRGCLAGPVVAGAVWTLRGFYEVSTPIRRAAFINDSKKLSSETREEVFALVEHWEKSGALIFSAGTASVREIDEHNILGASKLAMQRAVAGVLEKFSARAPAGTPCPFASAGADDAPLFCKGTAFPLMLVDGRPLTSFAWRHEGLVKGDATSLAVALGSIVAKVTRDRLMRELDAEFPGYGFATHKGYGTDAHVAAILERGVTPQHRTLFLRHLAATSPHAIAGLEHVFRQEDSAPPQSEFNF